MKKKAATPSGTDPLLAPILDVFAGDRAVSVAKMFGSSGLRVGGKVFAMVVKGKLVVKLPKARVGSLVSSRSGRHFDPGHGRLMKEWVAVGVGKAPWVELAEEAYRFVKGGK